MSIVPDFRASDGVRIAYRDEGAGRPLLFIPGLTADAATFDAQAAFAPTCRVLRIDVRGHGESEPDRSATLARAGQDIAELIARLDLDGIVGIGWSLGAMLLWSLLANESAARFAGGISIDMAPKVANDDDWALGLRDPERRTSPPGEDWPDRSRRMAQLIVADPANEAVVDAIEASMLRSDPDTVAALNASMMREDSRPLLPRIAAPMIVSHGALSPYYAAATSAWIAHQLGDARVVTFRRSGHAPHMEEPEAFNAMLAGLLDRLSSTNTNPAAARGNRGVSA